MFKGMVLVCLVALLLSSVFVVTPAGASSLADPECHAGCREHDMPVAHCAATEPPPSQDAHTVASAKCYNCNGSGDCWNCWGSGTTSDGKTCYMCGGSKKCYYCKGEGKT